MFDDDDPDPAPDSVIDLVLRFEVVMYGPDPPVIYPNWVWPLID